MDARRPAASMRPGMVAGAPPFPCGKQQAVRHSVRLFGIYAQFSKGQRQASSIRSQTTFASPPAESPVTLSTPARDAPKHATAIQGRQVGDRPQTNTARMEAIRAV